MTYIINFELRLCSLVTHNLTEFLKVSKRILKYKPFSLFKHHLFPFVFPFPILFRHGKEPKIYRPHVKGCEFGPEFRDNRHPLLHSHSHATPCGGTDDYVRFRPDLLDDLFE